MCSNFKITTLWRNLTEVSLLLTLSTIVWFSDVFRGYRKSSVTWNGLIYLQSNLMALSPENDVWSVNYTHHKWWPIMFNLLLRANTGPSLIWCQACKLCFQDEGRGRQEMSTNPTFSLQQISLKRAIPSYDSS